MTTRTVTGTIYHPSTGAAWGSVAVYARLESPFTDGATTYTPELVTAISDNSGAFSFSLAVPSNGTSTASYSFHLPGYGPFVANLMSGGALAIATLINAPGVAVPTSALDAHELTQASTTVLGHVKVDGTTIRSSNGIISSAMFFCTTADKTGATDATTQLQADLTTAIAAGVPLYLPAGTYKIALTSGVLFDISADRVEIFGAGIGKTVLLLPANTALTGHVKFFRTTAKHTHIHDLTMQGGAGISAAGQHVMYGVSVDTGAFYPHLHDLEAIGFYGNTAAGGSPFDLYQTWNQAEASITLGTAIAAGARAVTPGSMAGIYPGRRLAIGGTAEEVIVTSTTATTFTATFANAHGATDSVTAYANNNQYALVERCISRDSPQATGFVINSSANTIRDCAVINCGNATTMHGVYDQGGKNLVERCYFEGCSGYHLHGYKSAHNIDASGCVYRDNISINPGAAHCIVQAAQTGDGTVPDLPNGSSDARYVLIMGNLFKTTKGAGTGMIDCVNASVPTIIADNMLEDAAQKTGIYWITATAGGVIKDNTFRILNALDGFTAITAGAAMLIEGNHFLNWQYPGIINVLDGTRVVSNYFDWKPQYSGDQCIKVSGGKGILVSGNQIACSGANGQAIRVIGNTSGLSIVYNSITGAGAASAIHFDDNLTLTGFVQYNYLESLTIHTGAGANGMTIGNNV